jgi:Flp pilus assembly protein TadG
VRGKQSTGAEPRFYHSQRQFGDQPARILARVPVDGDRADADPPPMIRRPASRRCGEAGSVAVEFAVILSPLVFLILGAIQFGFVFWNWNSMLLAVEEAGRYAMLYNAYPSNPPGCTNASPSLANCAVDWANKNLGGNFNVSCSSGCTAPYTTITFTATYTLSFFSSFTLSRAIQVPVI